MKATMRLTLDGLTRALRARMHEMADEIEAGYARRREAGDEEKRPGGTDDDDIGGD